MNTNVRNKSGANEEANELILQQLRSVIGELSKKRTQDNAHAISTIARAICDPAIIVKNLVSATERLTGLKRDWIVDGCSSNSEVYLLSLSLSDLLLIE